MSNSSITNIGHCIEYQENFYFAILDARGLFALYFGGHRPLITDIAKMEILFSENDIDYFRESSYFALHPDRLLCFTDLADIVDWIESEKNPKNKKCTKEEIIACFDSLKFVTNGKYKAFWETGKAKERLSDGQIKEAVVYASVLVGQNTSLCFEALAFSFDEGIMGNFPVVITNKLIDAPGQQRIDTFEGLRDYINSFLVSWELWVEIFQLDRGENVEKKVYDNRAHRYQHNYY